MPDHDPLGDEAAQYVLDGLSQAERAGFETRMAHSAELRAQVRELEDGMAALALAAPRRKPPAKLWGQIEKELARESGWRKAVCELRHDWWRNGWAAAAACLVGWALYAFYVNEMRPSTRAPMEISEASATQRGTSTNSAPMEKNAAIHPPSRTAPTNLARSDAALVQVQSLRKEIADLKTQVAQMSLSLAQQQAMLGESNRLKFLKLTPASADDSTTISQLSPALQRAIFIAMARELGWLPPENPPTSEESGVVRLPSTNQWNVDFVDLRPGANNPSSNPLSPKTESPLVSSAPASAPPTAASPTIPAFISGDNLIMAIDSTTVAKGSSLTFSTGATPDTQQIQGTTTLGDNPMVVTMPINDYIANQPNGVTVNIISTSTSGSSVLQFNVPPTINH
ncbi:MAG TPA: hypothetical protein VG754_07530 [Verrucomicrobiae bacterium]|nr:hypothetical protein [Verrucomicrobiae bacterium]